MLNPYLQLMETFRGRRSCFDYRRVRVHAPRYYSTATGAFLVTQYGVNATAGELALKWAGYGKRHTEILPLAVLHADGSGRFFTDGLHYAHPALVHFLTFFTEGRYGFHQNRSVKTNAEFVVHPPLYFNRDKTGAESGWTFEGCDHTQLKSDYYYAVRNAAAKSPYAALVRGGFEVTADNQVHSLEPVLRRTWLPEQRKKYLARRKELLTQSFSRAKLGAYDQLLDVVKSYGTINGVHIHTVAYQARDRVRRELVKLDPADPNTSDVLAKASLVSRTYYRNPATREILTESIKNTLEREAEQLRTGLGAVVYL